MEELQKRLQEIKDDIEDLKSIDDEYKKYMDMFNYLDKIEKEIK